MAPMLSSFRVYPWKSVPGYRGGVDQHPEYDPANIPRLSLPRASVHQLPSSAALQTRFVLTGNPLRSWKGERVPNTSRDCGFRAGRFAWVAVPCAAAGADAGRVQPILDRQRY